MVRDSDYTAGNLLDYEYFSTRYKLIAIDLSKQTADLEIQQISFIGKLEQNVIIFFIIETEQKTDLEFSQIIFTDYCIKRESQKIINLLEQSDDNELKLKTKKWHIINDQINGQYGKGNQSDSAIKFSTETIKSLLVDYSETYILVTGNITAVGGNANTNVAFKNCHPFTRSVIHLNDEHVDTAENLDLTMNLYNLVEYSDNYADTTASLYQYKRRQQPKTNAGGLDDVATGNSSSLKYKSSFSKGTTATNVAANVNLDVADAHRIVVKC